MLVFQNAIKRAGVPILRALNIQFRLKQQALTLRVEILGIFNQRYFLDEALERSWRNALRWLDD
jgi:hypothetical protein